MACLYHFVYLPVEGHQHSFHLGVVTSKAAMQIQAQVLVLT